MSSYSIKRYVQFKWRFPIPLKNNQLVLEGTGIVEVGDEELEVSRDTSIASPKDIPHCWYNRSDADLRILVVKIPRPTTGTKLL